MTLATALRINGVDVVLDKWDLKPGQDKYHFMESMVTDETVVKVLVMCDEVYQRKADSRAGGVGTESQIISQELYSKVQQTKFIPVICSRDADDNVCVPIFMKSRIFVDISGDQYGAGLESLLRQIYEQPFHQKPGLGAPPVFLASDSGIPVAKELGAALRAIQEAKPNRAGLEKLLVQSIFSTITRLYVQPEGNDFDDDLYQSVVRTKALRDQVAEYVDTVASFSEDEKAVAPFVQLLELLGHQFGPPVMNGAYNPCWSDIYKFFALETTLLVVAALLRHERWILLRRFLKTPFVVRTSNNGSRVTSVSAFDSYINGLDEHRNNRLRLNRTSLSADLLHDRCSPERTTFRELAQADVFLALDSAVHIHERHAAGELLFWTPRTTIYGSSEIQPMPVFMKAVDADVRNDIRTALGVSSAAEMKKRINAGAELHQNFKAFVLGRFQQFDFVTTTNLQLLITS